MSAVNVVTKCIFCAVLLLSSIHEISSNGLRNDISYVGGLLKNFLNYSLSTNFTDHPHRSDPEHRITTDDVIREAGYVAERHVVRTEDRYLLTVHRIPRGKHERATTHKPVVILQHGLLLSSASWVTNGNDSLERDLQAVETFPGFLLADEGYDVWLPNMRGNSYSRAHEFLNPDDTNSYRFWDHSFHEMGYYDMPAIMDYILASTGQSKVFYIGHSIGTTVSYVLASTRPEYNKRIKAVFSFAPIAFLGNVDSPLQIISELYEPKLLNHLLDIGLYELFPQNKWVDFIDKYICNKYTITSGICQEVVGRLTGIDVSQTDQALLHRILQHYPAGVSLKVRQHYNQIATAKKFRQFNYGWVDNMRHYGHMEPPDYQLHKVTTPILMFFGKDDFFSIKSDVDVLFNKLPHIVGKIIIKYDEFNHFDFMFAKDIKTLLYDYVIDVLNRYRRTGSVDVEYLRRNKNMTVL